MAKQEIQENPENDKILSLMLADEILSARVKQRATCVNQWLCDNLGIQFISNSPYDGEGSYLDLYPSLKDIQVEKEAVETYGFNPNSQEVLYGASNS